MVLNGKFSQQYSQYHLQGRAYLCSCLSLVVSRIQAFFPPHSPNYSLNHLVPNLSHRITMSLPPFGLCPSLLHTSNVTFVITGPHWFSTEIVMQSGNLVTTGRDTLCPMYTSIQPTKNTLNKNIHKHKQTKTIFDIFNVFFSPKKIGRPKRTF